MSTAVPSFERWLFHGSLVLEQVVGHRIFGALGGEALRTRIRARLELHLADRPSPLPISVERRENLTPEEFRRDYLRKGKPVIFSGAAASWPCINRWNLDYFSVGYGDQDLLLVNAAGLTSRSARPGFEFLPLRDLVRDIRGAGEKYLRFSPLLHNSPELTKDLDLPWLDSMRGANTFARTYYMFLGGAGQKTLLHNDQPCNLYLMVHGEKKWTLFDCRESALLYPEVGSAAYVKSQVNVGSPDLARHPLFTKAQPYVANLRAGDVLYVPPFLWHEVENLGETIAVGYRFSSLRAALKSSAAFTLLRALSTNPPIWRTMKYGKQDTNLIWAHSGGIIREVLAARETRRKARANGGK